jgi:hypothetical protein
MILLVKFVGSRIYNYNFDTPAWRQGFACGIVWILLRHKARFIIVLELLGSKDLSREDSVTPDVLQYEYFV